jgi:hypothetical protein
MDAANFEEDDGAMTSACDQSVIGCGECPRFEQCEEFGLKSL